MLELQFPCILSVWWHVATVEALEKPLLPVKRTGRITMQIAEAVADMVSHQMTEMEAVTQLGIKYQVWKNWKQRRKAAGTFDYLVTRIRGSKIRGCIRQIEKAANGQDGVRHDWRAADRLLTIAAPDRFSDRHQEGQAVTQVAISIDMAGVIGQMVQERLAKEGRIAAVVTDIQPTMLAHTTQEGSSGNAVK